ncbi:hypothetical protein Z956_08145 [Clostridium botulinum D str. CCUG 7971]|uniref:hypothetical protein n=1 Tax=Clostridium botulinum TaxID=1491 RepID=UPI00052E403C|nr:hypothetical protein [Clostridium botulinum]KGM94296.1 hypothetical protein Z956_08145 [Clostridium botulinum D str. CCUG 7971]
MDNAKIVDEIVKYYMNPKKYPNDGKIAIEDAIKTLDTILLNGESGTTNVLVNTLFKKYTSNGLDAPINATILKTRADEQGLSATRGYKEIYFNEIVQNANDNTTSDNLDIILSKKGNIYEMTLQYEDIGFSVENIVGFFNTEIHTKRYNFSATGKHGIGIKSLFYFVDYMKIESNVRIEFNITTVIEDETEKITEVKSEIVKNEDWYKSKDKKTSFTIRFPQKDSYGEFNVSKLKDFINLFYQDGKVSYSDINKYYFGLEQNDLIFDVRGLLFTDKNKGKNGGIKNLCFYKENFESKLFEISCTESKKFETARKIVCKAEIKYNNEEDTKLSYLLFTKEGEEGEQNFSTAFPMKLGKTNRRYYETYYIPEADEVGVNILVNSKYSNVARTKLTDDDSKKENIKEEIENALIDLYCFMVSENCATSEIGVDISLLFHKLLLLDESFVEQCYNNNFNNRYLAKYIDDKSEARTGKYIVYKRREKEELEKKLIGQKFKKDESDDFFNNYILKNDSIKYDDSLFREEICEIYKKAFMENGQVKLRSVLNVAGTIRDLIYYRVHKRFPKDDKVMLNDTEVDAWNENIWDIEEGCESEKQKKVLISLSIIGRYKLHSYLTSAGEITGASFHEFLFNEKKDNGIVSYSRYPTLTRKQQELYGVQYGELKNRLLNLLVNREQEGIVQLYGSKIKYEVGTVAFYGSRDTRASYSIYYNREKAIIYDYYDNGNLNSSTEKFGQYLSELFVKKILDEEEILKHIINFQGKIMLTSGGYPLWGEPTYWYWRDNLLQTGEWFKCRLINIDFLRTIYAYSWESFVFYLKEFLEGQNIGSGIVKKYGGFNLYTYTQKQQLFGIDVTDIAKIFKFFYENNRYVKNESMYTINFQINLVGDIQNNLCPYDYYNYLQKQINKKVYVMQTNSVNDRKKEVMYWYGREFKMWGGEEWHIIGTGIRTNTDEIIIIHNEKMDYKEAIRKVLENILGKNDVLDKCDAFIPAGQNYAIQGEEYDDLTSYNNDGNQRSQENIVVQNANGLSCEALKKIIIARGNNDNACCCCGKQLTSTQLIITNNSNDDTRKEYPQIVEVVCEKCEEILRKSHKSTSLVKEDKNYYVNYCCDIQNSHQNKEVIFKVKICDGVLALCKC